PKRAIGFTEEGWGDDQQLINLEYQRYMLQVGFIDLKVGELVARLKQKGIYDDALIVLTGDHGRIFAQGRGVRTISEENAELLHVPLIIKLPGQTERRVSEVTASTLDVLPT